MPENNVTVAFVSIHSLPEGGEDPVEQAPLPGNLRRTEKGWAVTYREAENGLGETRTTLRLEGDRVELIRTGEFPSRLLFQTGEEHTSLYETPYGELPLTVRTAYLRYGMTEQGGAVELDYTMELDGTPLGRFRLRVDVRERRDRK